MAGAAPRAPAAPPHAGAAFLLLTYPVPCTVCLVGMPSASGGQLAQEFVSPYVSHPVGVEHPLDQRSVGSFSSWWVQIIYDINWRFLQQLRLQFGDDWERISRMSIIEDGPSGEKLVRMAFLGVITAHTVNGVAEIHSRILKEELFKDFAEVL